MSDIKRIKNHFLIGAAMTSILLLFSAYWQINHEYRLETSIAKTQAYSNLQTDLLYRQWATLHGGVYVPVTEDTPPNEYLTIDGRDLIINDSLTLTLVNPAYMTRQVYELESVIYKTKGHITSLDPIRKANIPDPWEERMLVSFETGVTDTFDLDVLNGEKYFRYMEPMVTSQGCLKCHAQQGYELGDVRGGLSVSIPAEPYLRSAFYKSIFIVAVHLAVAVLFAFLGFISFRMVVLKIIDNEHVRSELMEQKMALERQNSDIESKSTEYRELAEKFQKQNLNLQIAVAKAEESDRLKSSFLNNMSHEIRTPMNGIFGFSQMLTDANLTDDKRDYFVKIIQESSMQLLDIVNDILEIAKVETGLLDVNNVKTSTRGILDSIMGVWQKKICAKGLSIKLENNIPEEDDLFVLDENKLFRIVNNLMSNALKFTTTGGIELSSWVEDDAVCVSVKDSGIGISSVQQDQVFERFRKADVGDLYAFGGTGLGLSICKGYAEFLGGTISLESEEGKGATFTYKQPFDVEATLAERSVVADELELIEDVTLTAENFTVLVAEDERNNFLFINELLSREHCTVVRALNGSEAVEYLRNGGACNLVLMDLKMPVMDGFEATRQIKKLNPSVPVVAQTAFVASQEIKIAKEAGCEEVLSKPIDKEKLRFILDKYLRLA